MRKVFFLVPFCLLLNACQVEGELTSDRPLEQISTLATLKYYGQFEPTNGISVNGSAKIYLDRNLYKVSLEGFSITDGPDLKVYLSKSASPTEYINLGNLTEQRVYPIPSGIQVENYTHVLIHCQQYNHLFAIAELNEN